jgi:hypothetical protein
MILVYSSVWIAHFRRAEPHLEALGTGLREPAHARRNNCLPPNFGVAFPDRSTST